jgi:hypothetical protein
MHETVTVGMIVWPLLGLLGIAVVIGIVIYVLSIFADAFKH